MSLGVLFGVVTAALVTGVVVMAVVLLRRCDRAGRSGS